MSEDTQTQEKILNTLQSIEAEIKKGNQPPEPIGVPGAGPATDTRKDYERWPRKVKIFTGEVPWHDGKEQTRFVVNEKCGIEEDGKACRERLIAVKVANSHFEKDTFGFGGQLTYDPKDARVYLFCVIHGPHPAGPARWGKDGKALD